MDWVRVGLPAFALMVLLASCGGGGRGGGGGIFVWNMPPNTEVSFPTSSYEVEVPQDGSAPVALTATVWVQSFLVSACSLNVEPHGPAANPTAGDGPWTITPNTGSDLETAGVAHVPVTVSPLGGPGSYPLGSFTFTAAVQCGTSRAESSMTLQVRQPMQQPLA